jgi:hypothetical protein
MPIERQLAEATCGPEAGRGNGAGIDYVFDNKQRRCKPRESRIAERRYSTSPIQALDSIPSLRSELQVLV